MAVVAFSLHILGFVSHPLAALPPRPPRTHAALVYERGGHSWWYGAYLTWELVELAPAARLAA